MFRETNANARAPVPKELPAVKSVRFLDEKPQRLAAMCLAPLRSSYVSTNFFEPLSEGTEETEEWPELGSEPVR